MKKRISSILGILIVGFISANFLHAQNQDAIAIRVIPNPKHLSVENWYTNQGFEGSPQALTVDGYEAIRDGRTVYVNVGNVNAAGSLFTNIYLISYNQNAQPQTTDIFSKILQSWKFNSNLQGNSNCHFNTGMNCLIDEDCIIGDYCDSAKARVIRDVKRLSDVQNIKKGLQEYYHLYGKYPALSSGTYLPNKSLSVWPSWKSSLSVELGFQLPYDPVNRLGECLGYNQQTCWDEANSRFATNLPNLPDGSLAYYYFSDAVGMVVDVCMVSESGFTIIPAPDCLISVCLDFDGDGYGKPASPVCVNIQSDCDDSDPAVNIPGIEICDNGSDDDCDGLVDCFDSNCIGNSACTAVSYCGDTICDSSTENSVSCPQDCSAGGVICGDGVCDPSECSSCYNASGPNASADCYCGDGVQCSVQGETCDDGANVDGDGCSPTCLIEIIPCTDNDGDLYINEGTDISVCNDQSPPPCGASANMNCLGNNDCDDNNASRNPGMSELCDNIDHDCDGNNTNGFSLENCNFACFAAGFQWTGNGGTSLNCCGNDSGEGVYNISPALNTFQLNENQPTDFCTDGLDNDCDGDFDNNVSNPTNPDTDCLVCNSGNNTDESFWYVASEGDCDQCDHDGDDSGNQSVGEDWSAWPAGTVDRCDAACGTVSATVHSYDYEDGAELTCNDLIDNDCDGLVDCLDSTDCAGSPFCVFSCTGTVPANSSLCAEDGLGLTANTVRSLVTTCTDQQKCEYVCNGGYTYVAGQCLHPCYEDADGDGFGNLSSVAQYSFCPGTGIFVDDNTDCDDTRAYVYPGAPEQCNGLDSDCNSGTLVDNGCDDDGDGYCDMGMFWYSGTSACPNSSLTDGNPGDDCDDNGVNAANRHPGNTEICTGGIDEDCDGQIDCADISDCSTNLACCTSTCTSGPGCQAIAVPNSIVTGDECCGAGTCYECDAGYEWDGSVCVLSGSSCEFNFTFPCTF